MEAYLDNWRSTKVASEVLDAMMPYLTDMYGVPSGLYEMSMKADLAVEEAQATVAGALNGDPKGVVFTSGATEANNLAIQGLARARGKGHVITTRIEHPSVMDPCEALAKEGWDVDVLDVDPEGFIDIEQLEGLLRPDTALVSILYVSHVVGTIQPLREVADVLSTMEKRPVLHSNCVGAFGLMPLDVERLGLDMVSISSHKIHGPKGVGALWMRPGVRIAPLMRGVTSMSKLRPGEENVPGIVGFAKAVELAMGGVDENLERAREKWEHLHGRVMAELPGIKLNGPVGHGRSPYNLNISFRSIEGEAVTLQLDGYGISVATGSACASKNLKTNYVITALGNPPEVAHGSIRMTMSRYTTREELDYAMDRLKEVHDSLNRITAYRPGLEGKGEHREE